MRPETKNADHSAGAARRKRGFLARLKGDASGNALMLTAACMIPIAAAIGGGVDMSRAYLAKARLNQACDAAALAARRSMTGLDITASANSTARDEGTKFFNFNFPAGTMETTPINPNGSGVSQGPTYTTPEDGTVRVAAATNVPTSIMKIFGYTQIPISVQCDATQNLVNVDIMLVLDTTGSMAQNVSGSPVGDYQTTSKMYALRQAVLALYDQLADMQTRLQGQNLRLRYGFVPYSSTVNVGRVIPSSYIVSGDWTYQSRENVLKTKAVNKKSNCDSIGGTFDSSTKICTYTELTYKPVTYNVGSYVSGSNWSGCIEERQTVSTITDGFTGSVPIEAKDLDINLLPTSDSTKWAPYFADQPLYAGKPLPKPLPNIDGSNKFSYNSNVYGRNSDQPSTSGWEPQKACPRHAQRLSVMSRPDVENYVNSLYSDGGTYHDIGMIWGARFISGKSIFSSDNPDTFNDHPVNRYIVFMTDGILDTGTSIYTAYGLEELDKRVTGGWTSDPDQTGRHRSRFLLACTAAKTEGVNIWTVVFASATENTLTSCASSTDNALVALTAADLKNRFTTIARSISSLVLSK